MKRGWRFDSERHSLSRRGIKNKCCYAPLTLHSFGLHFKSYPALYKFQDEKLENTSLRGIGIPERMTRLRGHTLEASMDIFREATQKYSHFSYIQEKIDKIYGDIDEAEMLGDWGKLNQVSEDDLKAFKKNLEALQRATKRVVNSKQRQLMVDSLSVTEELLRDNPSKDKIRKLLENIEVNR